MNAFLKAVLFRALRTVCQTAVATIGSAAVIADVNWWLVISASLLAGLISVLMSIATGLPETEYEKRLTMYVDEPKDSEVSDDEK